MSLYKIYINTCTYKFIYILYTLPKKKKKENENKNKWRINGDHVRLIKYDRGSQKFYGIPNSLKKKKKEYLYNIILPPHI